ncbi:MAG: hypothetical protein GY705_05900 [Bacteroidetes bacterium]|nr:hypothetical protein [Bacteroidota bacterium]
MKQLFFFSILLMLFVTSMASGCLFDEEQEIFKTTKGAILEISNAPSYYYFRYNIYEAENTVYSFFLDTRGEKVEYVKIYKRIDEEPLLELKDVHTIPSEVNITLLEVVKDSGIELDSMLNKDVEFTFDLYLEDGRISKSTEKMEVQVDCWYGLQGVYEVYTEYQQHNFLPDFKTHTRITEIFEDGFGEYYVEDLSGGLLSEGPYALHYGTDTLNLTGGLYEECSNIFVWDYYPFMGEMEENGTNVFDEETGEIILYWKFDKTGEEGISVYTPL